LARNDVTKPGDALQALVGRTHHEVNIGSLRGPGGARLTSTSIYMYN
jgi:hypothetical protein